MKRNQTVWMLLEDRTKPIYGQVAAIIELNAHERSARANIPCGAHLGMLRASPLFAAHNGRAFTEFFGSGAPSVRIKVRGGH